jgi:hypothetical protein
VRVKRTVHKALETNACKGDHFVHLCVHNVDFRSCLSGFLLHLVLVCVLKVIQRTEYFVPLNPTLHETHIEHTFSI